MNDVVEITLELDQLETRALGFGLGSHELRCKRWEWQSVAQAVIQWPSVKNTRLGPANFHLYRISNGSLNLISKRIRLDNLKRAFFHFAALTAAFENNDQRTAAKFCGTILVLASNALDVHASAGHA